MTTRACDFSSFKRPPRPPNSGGSSQANSEKTSSLRSNELNTSTDEGDIPKPKFVTSQSVDPSMQHRGNYDYLAGSASTFRDGTPPVGPMYSFSSSQNVDGYSSFHRTPKVNHSTIDRTTLPYDRRHKTPKFTPNVHDLPRHEEGNPGTGLVFLDGGRRGVMNADSQHSLDGSLNGRRMDRSLVKGRNGSEQYVQNNPHDTQYSPIAPVDPHEGYIPSNGTPYDVYYSPHDAVDVIPSQLPPNAGTYNGYHGKPGRGSYQNVSSGESGIAGCEYNTLGMSYESRGDVGVNSNFHYHGAAAAVRSLRPYEHHVETYADDQRGGSEETDDPHSQGSSQNSQVDGEGQREACSQRTLLLPTDSAVHFGGTEAQNNMRSYDPNASFSMGVGYNGSHKNSVPRISSRSNGKSKKNFNPFKKKSTTDVYRSNNLYGSKNKKHAQVSLDAAGVPSTGFPFDKRSYTSTKRPFCPKWQCVLLAAAIGIALFICAGLVLYFYVWPSVLQPLVESSKPVDGEWGSWHPWFQCSATCGTGMQNRTRECDSPSPEDGGKNCEGPRFTVRTCKASIECPDCSRVCEVGTLSKDCRSCTCEGHVITGKITDEYNNPLPGVKVYKGSGDALLLAGTNNEGEFEFEGICSNGNNELRLEKEMYRVSRVYPTQSDSDEKAGHVSFSMTRLFLPSFVQPPMSEERLADQKVVLCCGAESEQPPTKYIWYKDNSKLDPRLYKYDLKKPSLVLSDLMVWDGGEYACEVQNEAGSVKSDPATLTVYGNWSELCDPSPKDKFVSLPDGCSQTSFNTGTCGREPPSQSDPADSSSSETPQYSRCIAPGQYPDDADEDVCTASSDAQELRNKYCCKPVKEQEVAIACKQDNIGYNVALKRILKCGCTICD